MRDKTVCEDSNDWWQCYILNYLKYYTGHFSNKSLIPSDYNLCSPQTEFTFTDMVLQILNTEINKYIQLLISRHYILNSFVMWLGGGVNMSCQQ